MNFKALVFLAMLLASIFLISAEVASKDIKDDKTQTEGLDESKYGGYYGGGGYGGPWRGGGYGGWRGGYGGWRGGYGGWRGGYGGGRGGYGGWRGGYGGWRGGYGGGHGGWGGGGWPAEQGDAHINDEPQT